MSAANDKSVNISKTNSFSLYFIPFEINKKLSTLRIQILYHSVYLKQCWAIVFFAKFLRRILAHLHFIFSISCLHPNSVMVYKYFEKHI